MKTHRNAQHPTPNAQRSTSNFGVQHSFPTPNSSFLTPPSLQGFTLFELLAVITIIGIVLSVTLGSFTGWGDAHAVRGSADVVEAALNQARDYAVTHRTPVSFRYETCSDSTNGIKATAAFTLETFKDSQPIGAELQRLPGNVWLVPEVLTSSSAYESDNFGGWFVFFPNGTVSNAIAAQTFRFFVISRKMRDTAGTPNIAYTIDIDPATGTATAERYEH